MYSVLPSTPHPGRSETMRCILQIEGSPGDTAVFLHVAGFLSAARLKRRRGRVHGGMREAVSVRGGGLKEVQVSVRGLRIGWLGARTRCTSTSTPYL
jgi:hypothetical protein